MSYRFMRIMVLFDLPVETPLQRHNYGKFRRYLIKNGFMMMQESVYVKLALNQNTAAAIIDALKKNKPPEGLFRFCLLPKNSFQKLRYLQAIIQVIPLTVTKGC